MATYPLIQSVAGKTGAVVLVPADVPGVATQAALDVVESNAAIFRGADLGGGLFEVSLASVWAIGSDGIPYFDSAGATPGEDAWPSLDATSGAFTLTTMTGGTP